MILYTHYIAQEINIIETFGSITDKTSIINKANNIKYNFLTKEIKEPLREISYGFYISDNSITKSKISPSYDFINNELLNTLTNKDNYLEMQGKIISRMGHNVIYQKDGIYYLCRLEETNNAMSIISQVETPCNRVITVGVDFFCTTKNNNEIHRYYLEDNAFKHKVIGLEKPSFISGPKRNNDILDIYSFDSRFLTKYNFDGTIEAKVELEEISINDKMLFVGFFSTYSLEEQNEILFFDGTNAWGISFKDKKVLWKKQIDIIGEGVDRLGCYYVPTKQGIVAISSATGETKKIVDGDGWEIIDNLNSNENNTYYSGDSNVFRRKMDGKYEPLILLTTEGKAQVIRCEPYQGEDMGYIFLLDTRNGARESIYNFVFFTREGAYQYSLNNPFRLHYK
jgi:hypothetical protein